MQQNKEIVLAQLYGRKIATLKQFHLCFTLQLWNALSTVKRPVYSDTTRHQIELSCVAIDTLIDATQLSSTIGNATDPVEAYSQSARSIYRSVELS